MAASILRPPGPAHTRPFKTLHQFIHNPIKILTSLAKEYGDISYIKSISSKRILRALQKSMVILLILRLFRQNVYLIVALTDIGDIIAYKPGLHFCEEVYTYRNQ